MGRPIKKKFFGNLNNDQFGNVGTGSGIGGEGLATITNPAQLGSFIVNSTATTVPSLVIPAPALPTGVQATAQVVWEVESVTVTNGLAGNNYQTGTNATLTGLGGGVVINLATVGSGQGEVQTVNFATTTSNRGSFTTIPVAATTYQIVGSGVGNGDGNQQALVKFRVKQINVLTSGRGYETTQDVTFNNTGVIGTGPGNPGQTYSVTTQNALNVTAYIPTKNGGASAKLSDIVKQEASQRYLVKNVDGIGQCRLTATDTPAEGQMNLIATDVNGSTYWVTKLTARRCTLVQRTMSGSYTVVDGGTSGWTINGASTGVVSIASV
jgi:hypothetical protein